MTTRTLPRPRAADSDAQTYERIGTGELVFQAVFSALITVMLLEVGVIVFRVLEPLIHSAPRLFGSDVTVDETFTRAIANALMVIAPFAAYAVAGLKMKPLAQFNRARAIGAALVAAAIVYALVSMGQFVFQIGPFSEQPSLEMTLRQTDAGILVERVIEGGTAAEAGFEEGDVITAIRRAETTLAELTATVRQSKAGDVVRLRIERGGEEEQLPIQVAAVMEISLLPLLAGLLVALAVAVIAVFWPGGWTPYALLAVIMLPLVLGYLWLLIATFSVRTEGLLPVDAQGEIGGLTLRNWEFLTREATGSNPSIWTITLNTFVIASSMMAIVLLVSSMAGYALSRMNFAGRRTFLSLTLILHGFPAVTLLIAIFFVLRNLGTIPFLGDYFGFNTRGGIALVMVAFELPLGVWLMKGFFDGIPWDIERSALIDGASRWRTFYEILLPQIRPGLLALGIFAFISGWGAYLIPQTYSIGTKTATLAVYINQLTSDTAPVNWNEIAAVGLFQMLPVFVIFVFAQEYLLNIYAGGTKGSS